jgi:tetratricopeptide (TPR) repeat protein
LERFGWRVGELAPLRVMATFGIDAVEDAPRRAAASALAAMKALERDAQAVTVRAALEVVDRLLTRAGPITGMDRAERRETQLTIDDLLASAAPSEILVSASALPHLDRSFELVTASGTTELGRVSHRLLPRERSGLLIGGRGQSSFVGRASELALLHTVLDRAERGHGQIVGILGEPGIGKSRLLHEFRATLDSDRATYLLARCVSYGSTIPYLPVVDVVRSVFGLSDGDDFDTVEAKLGRGVRATGLEPSTCVPYLLHLLGWRAAFESLADVSPEAVRMRSLDTLWALLGAASRARLTVCAIEDLQWIDPSSEEVLFRLIERLEGSSLLVLATYRPGYQPRWLGRSYAHQLALGRLTAADSLTVLKAHLPETNLAGGLTARLLDQADGIPFHLEELARALGQNPHPDAVIAVPPTLQGILAARLSRLPTTQCKLLQASAVIGREFSSATLAETVGQPLTQIRSELAALQAADFVVEILDRFRHVYRFRHALTQEVAYRTLLDHERRDLHARVAAAIESAEPDIVERRPEILARHYAEAGFPQQAASYSIHAGRLALGRSALVEAVVHLRHGLQLVALLQSTPERTHAELTLQLDLGTALAAQGGYAAPEVAEPLERARALADQLGDVPELFPVRWALWRFAFSRADYGTARTLAHQLRNTAVGPEGDDRRRVAELAVGAVHFYMGEFDSAAHAFQAAWHMHTPAGARAQILLYGQDLGAAARAFQAWAQALGAELDRSEQTGAEALHAARATGHPFSIGFTLYIVAWAAQLRGDTAYLQTLGSELAALAEQYSFKLLTAFGLMVRGWAARGTGDIEQAVDMITRGAELFRAVGQRAGLFHRALMAEAVLAAGSEDRSEEILHDALAQADATGEQGSLAELHRLLGDVKTRRNDAAGAEACYQRALEVATRQGAWLLALRAATGSVRLTRTTGVPSTEATRRLGEVIGQLPAGAEGHELRAARTLLDE